MKKKSIISIIMLSVVIAACDSGKSKAPEKSIPVEAKTEQKQLKPFELLIDWQAEPTYLGVYYAKTIGAYQKLGLDVKVIQSWGANEAASAIAAGTYKIGTASGGATAIANSNGAGLVSTAVLYHRLPTAVFGLKESGIKKPKDLEGKKIGIYPKSITKNEFEAFAKLNGLNLKKVEIVSISGPDIPLILAGKLDGVLNYFELSPTILSLERETYSMLLADNGAQAYGLNIITSKKAYIEEPDLVKNITNAIITGYQEGCKDQKSAVDAFLKEFPEKDRKYVETSWDKVCDFIGGDYGTQTTEGWQQTIDLYKNTGIITQPISPKDVMP